MTSPALPNPDADPPAEHNDRLSYGDYFMIPNTTKRRTVDHATDDTTQTVHLGLVTDAITKTDATTDIDPDGQARSLLRALLTATGAVAAVATAVAAASQLHITADRVGDAAAAVAGVFAAVQAVYVAAHVLAPPRDANAPKRVWRRLRLAFGYGLLGSAGVGLLLLNRAGHLPPWATHSVTAIFGLTWYLLLDRFSRRKFTLGLPHLMAPAEPGGLIVATYDRPLHILSDRLCGTGSNVGAPTIVTAVLSAIMLVAGLAGVTYDVLVTRPAQLQTLPSVPGAAPGGAVPEIDFPGLDAPLTAPCEPTLDVEQQLTAGLSPASATAAVAVWRSFGADLLGCPQSLPVAWHGLHVIPLTGGSLTPAMILTDDTTGKAVAVREGATAIVWPWLTAGRLRGLWPAWRLPFGQWQRVDLADGACELIRSRYGAAVAFLEVPPSVLRIAAVVSAPHQALFTINPDGHSDQTKRYHVTLWGGPTYTALTGSVNIAYSLGTATGAGMTATDRGAGCAPEVNALFARAAASATTIG